MTEPTPVIRRVAACAGLAAFLYQFENCMTATALPVMSGEVPHLAGVVALVPAAYLVAAMIAMVPAGRLAARAVHHRVLAAALATMAIGSLICWLAPGAVVLLLGRAMQGLGGGAMASAAYGMVAVCVPPDARRGVLGWISLGAGLGMIVGTPLGGLIAASISWRALFALQIPLLLAAAVLMLRMRFGPAQHSAVTLGFARSLILGTGAACACLAGSLGHEFGFFSPPILGLQIAALLILAGFVWSEQGARAPLFPREVWRALAFWPYWGLLFACSAALGATVFLLPFYLHEVAGLSVPDAARWMVIQVAAYSLAALNARRFQTFLATESQALIGVALALAGVGLFATGTALAIGPIGIALSCALTGFGLGLIFPAVNAGCVARLPDAVRGLGAALLPLGLNLGSMTGTIATAEIREWHLHTEAHTQDYAQAFLVILLALVIAGAGFWRESRATSRS